MSQKGFTDLEHGWDGDDLFRLGYLCGWAQGWGCASSPWLPQRAKRLIYLRRTRELLNAFDGSEHEGLLERWNEMYLEEFNMYTLGLGGG